MIKCRKFRCTCISRNQVRSCRNSYDTSRNDGIGLTDMLAFAAVDTVVDSVVDIFDNSSNDFSGGGGDFGGGGSSGDW